MFQFYALSTCNKQITFKYTTTFRFVHEQLFMQCDIVEKYLLYLKSYCSTLLHKSAQLAVVTQLCAWLQLILWVPDSCTGKHTSSSHNIQTECGLMCLSRHQPCKQTSLDINTLRPGVFKLFKCTFPGSKQFKSTFILCFFKNL